VGTTVESNTYYYPEELCGFISPSGFLIAEKSLQKEQALIILHPKLGQMVNGIVLPIKKVFALVDSKISVEIKDEGRKLQGRLVAVDEYLNIHMDETIEFVDNQRGRSLGTVVIRGNNILTIAPVV
jgi:small nuclear ribonucleoprotein (snRNP)-like protein